MEYLEITDAQGRRRHVRLDQPRYLIGREKSCDIFLDHLNVSRRHAQLQRTARGEWLLQDLKSLNHVYYGGDKVEQVTLEPGRPVRIAEFRITLKAAPALPDPADLLPGTDEEGSTPSWPGLEPGWLEQLQMFQRALLRMEEPRQVLERLAEEFRRIVRPQFVAVGLSGAEGYDWPVVVADELTDVSQSLSLACQHLDDDSEVRGWIEGFTPQETPSAAAPFCMLFPMKGRSGILGHVFAQRPRQLPVPAAVQRYLSLFANYAGLLWENLQVIALRTAQRAMEQELRQARQIQVELFPPTFDLDPRLSASAVNLPSVRVSGDYYDLVKTGPDTVAFVIADAMGHGMPAALMMAAVRATLRMGLTLGLTWEDLFKGVDGIILQARVNSFVTGLVGEVNLATRELRLAVAGHQPPSVLAGGPALVPEECQTRPWGLDFDSPWEVAHLPLGEGDWSILCYTDGISDALIRPQQPYGKARVVEFHRSQPWASADDLCQGLLSAIASQQLSTTLADDQTVLVLCSAR